MTEDENVSSSLATIDHRVGQRLSSLRRGAGLPLRELAEKSGLSAAYLSRVENGHSAITLANLSRLSEIFGLSLSTFFEETEAIPPYALSRAGSGRTWRYRGRRGTRVHQLAEERPGKMMEPLLVEVEASDEPVEPEGHPGEELNYVLQGACDFIYGSERIRLEAGDSIYFDARVPHALHRVDGEGFKALAVVSSRDFPAHGAIAKILVDRLRA